MTLGDALQVQVKGMAPKILDPSIPPISFTLAMLLARYSSELLLKTRSSKYHTVNE